jgi:hypothetical protein
MAAAEPLREVARRRLVQRDDGTDVRRRRFAKAQTRTVSGAAASITDVFASEGDQLRRRSSRFRAAEVAGEFQ